MKTKNETIFLTIFKIRKNEEAKKIRFYKKHNCASKNQLRKLEWLEKEGY